MKLNGNVYADYAYTDGANAYTAVYETVGGEEAKSQTQSLKINGERVYEKYFDGKGLLAHTTASAR